MISDRACVAGYRIAVARLGPGVQGAMRFSAREVASDGSRRAVATVETLRRAAPVRWTGPERRG